MNFHLVLPLVVCECQFDISVEYHSGYRSSAHRLQLVDTNYHQITFIKNKNISFMCSWSLTWKQKIAEFFRLNLNPKSKASTLTPLSLATVDSDLKACAISPLSCCLPSVSQKKGGINKYTLCRERNSTNKRFIFISANARPLGEQFIYLSLSVCCMYVWESKDRQRKYYCVFFVALNLALEWNVICM